MCGVLVLMADRREAEVDVVTIRFNDTTGVCLEHLTEQLLLYKDRKLLIGSFSAASNVTGHWDCTTTIT